MSTTEDSLSCLFSLPGVDAERFEAMRSVIMSTWPTAPLVYRIDDTGHIHELSRPAQWLSERVASRETALVCNGDEKQLISLSATEPPFEPPFIHLRLRTNYYNARLLDSAFGLMRDLGLVAGAYIGDMTTGSTGSQIIDLYHRDPEAHALVPDDSPVSPLKPFLFGWINYWCAETCDLFDFSFDDPRSRLFHRIERCDNGALVFQVTEAPFDLDDPAHLAALDAAFDAFAE